MKSAIAERPLIYTWSSREAHFYFGSLTSLVIESSQLRLSHLFITQVSSVLLLMQWKYFVILTEEACSLSVIEVNIDKTSNVLAFRIARQWCPVISSLSLSISIHSELMSTRNRLRSPLSQVLGRTIIRDDLISIGCIDRTSRWMNKPYSCPSII